MTHDNLLMKIALTMPSATAGRMGAMAVMAGTVVVTAGLDITPVVTPPVPAVTAPVAAPPVAPDTTVPPALGIFLQILVRTYLGLTWRSAGTRSVKGRGGSWGRGGRGVDMTAVAASSSRGTVEEACNWGVIMCALSVKCIVSPCCSA